MGDVDLSDVQVTDALSTTYAAASSFGVTDVSVTSVSTVSINARFKLTYICSLFYAQYGEEGLLRDLDRSYLFHPPLAGLLFL